MSWWAVAFEIQLSLQSEVLSLWVTYATSKARKLILFLINLCRIHLCLCKLGRGQVGKRLQLSKSCWWLHGYDKVLKWLLQQRSKEISKKRQSHVRQELSPFSSREIELFQMFCFWTACEPCTIVSSGIRRLFIVLFIVPLLLTQADGNE